MIFSFKSPRLLYFFNNTLLKSNTFLKVGPASPNRRKKLRACFGSGVWIQFSVKTLSLIKKNFLFFSRNLSLSHPTLLTAPISPSPNVALSGLRGGRRASRWTSGLHRSEADLSLAQRGSRKDRSLSRDGVLLVCGRRWWGFVDLWWLVVGLLLILWWVLPVMGRWACRCRWSVMGCELAGFGSGVAGWVFVRVSGWLAVVCRVVRGGSRW